MQKYKNKQNVLYSEAVIQEHVGGICGKKEKLNRWMSMCDVIKNNDRILVISECKI